MVILGIETSCDETAASVVKNGREILSHVVASSAQMHVETGGIIPERAAREQVRSIIPVVEQALVKAFEVGNEKWENGKRSEKLEDHTSYVNNPASHISHLTSNNIDAIAVTIGPGLTGSLLVGVETARTLAYVWNKPIIPVNHLAAHIYANWLGPEVKTQNAKRKTAKSTGPRLPAVALVVSGGHTDLVLLKNHGEILWIGGTRDDAAGECFDKTARILGLPYPGGPAIAAEAEKYAKRDTQNEKIKLPRPMIDEENFDFSFSGLKTAVLREVSKVPPADAKAMAGKQVSKAIAHEIQEAITDVLVVKTLHAVEKYKVSTLLLAGGVAANQRLREKFEMEIGKWKMEIDLRVPPPWLCTDNASYIAAYAYYNYKPIPWQKISVNPGLTITEIQ